MAIISAVVVTVMFIGSARAYTLERPRWFFKVFNNDLLLMVDWTTFSSKTCHVVSDNKNSTTNGTSR